MHQGRGWWNARMHINMHIHLLWYGFPSQHHSPSQIYTCILEISFPFHVPMETVVESKRYIPEKRRGKVRQSGYWKRGRCTLHCKDSHVVSTAATKTTIPGENYHAVWQVHSQLSIPLLHVPNRDTHCTAYIGSYTLTIHCEQDVIASTIVNVLLLYPAEHTHGRYVDIKQWYILANSHDTVSKLNFPMPAPVFAAIPTQYSRLGSKLVIENTGSLFTTDTELWLVAFTLLGGQSPSSS